MSRRRCRRSGGRDETVPPIQFDPATGLDEAQADTPHEVVDVSAVIVHPEGARGLGSGQVAWVAPGDRVDVLASGSDAEVLAFELKTAPSGTH